MQNETVQHRPSDASLPQIATAPGPEPRPWSWPWLRHFTSQLVKFGLVGGLGVFVDLGIYTLLRTTVLTPEEFEWGPMAAKVIATLVAIGWNWLGNRYWTFRAYRKPDNTVREGFEFLGVSLVGMVIGLTPLWITHYLLGLDSLLVENLANLIGIGMGSVFRFALYRWWVFSPRRVRRKHQRKLAQ